jgi:hypothetical protein
MQRAKIAEAKQRQQQNGIASLVSKLHGKIDSEKRKESKIGSQEPSVAAAAAAADSPLGQEQDPPMIRIVRASASAIATVSAHERKDTALIGNGNGDGKKQAGRSGSEEKEGAVSFTTRREEPAATTPLAASSLDIVFSPVDTTKRPQNQKRLTPVPTTSSKQKVTARVSFADTPVSVSA